MIIVNITINIAPEWLDHQLHQERMYQRFKAISDKEAADQRAAIEDLQAMTHKITCSQCGWTGTGYQTPGRAKMGLSGHSKPSKAINILSCGWDRRISWFANPVSGFSISCSNRQESR